MDMADHRTAVLSAAAGSDFRLRQMETQDIARKIQSVARPFERIWERFSARVENRLISFVLRREIRRSLENASDYDAAMRRFAQIRHATATGRFNVLSAMNIAPPDNAAAVTQEVYEYEEETPSSWNPELQEQVIFYVPGGGFILPPSPKQVALAFRLAEYCNAEAVIGKHRLAPENPFPIAINDLADQYAGVLSQGRPPEKILLAGDSAGANLILSMLLEIRRRGLPMPSGAVLFSPWADLAMRGWSYISKGLSSDSPFSMETAAFSAKLYLGDVLPTDPRASPAYADLRGFPPLAIHCSRYDMHFDDAVTLSENARDSGVFVRMNYWESPRHHLERFNSSDAEKSFKLVAEFADHVSRAAP